MDTQQEKANHEGNPGGVFRRSYLLAKQSFSLIRKDSYLIFFPLVSGGLTIFLLALFFALRVVLLGIPEKTSTGALFFLLFVVIFLSIFARVGVALSLRLHLSGKILSLRSVIKKTAEKFSLIFGWSIVASLVSVVLMVIPFNIYSLVVSGLLGAYWTLATYFIVPSLSEEGSLLSDVFDDSISALKVVWKEMVVINAVFEVLFALVFILLTVLLRDLVILFPVVAKVMPVFAGVSVIVMVLLVFFSVLVWVFGELYRTSFNLVLYLQDPRHRLTGTAETGEKKTSRKKIV
jgi:hypothetical protein